MNFRIQSIASTLIFGFCALYASAAGVGDYPEISRYVGYERLPKSEPEWQYAADGSGYLAITSDGKRIAKYDIKTGKEIETLMDLDHTREITLPAIESFTVSPEGSKIMVCTKSEMVYRRSFTAEYYVYDIRSRMLRALSTDHPRQQSPIFSPNGRMVAFVSDNNIYIKKLDYNSEVAVTTNGAKNRIINGVPDWTYEEEFSTSCSMAWAPDDQTLCYLSYNETDVPEFSFQLYEGACERMPQYTLYPGLFSYKYPVAGQKNSIVTLHSYDVDNRKIKNIELKDSKIEYIPRINFGPTPDQLMVTTLNRDQNRMELYSVNPRSTTSKSLLVEQWNAWLAPQTYEDIRFLKDFFVVFSCRSGYQHLYLYSYSGAMLRQLTSGDFDVTDYYGFDSSTSTHFFQSTQTGAINRTVCKIDAKGKTTIISPETGTAALQSCSPTMSHFVMRYSNSHQAPGYELVASSSGKTVRKLTDNVDYQARWTDAPKPEFFTMQNDGYTLNGYIIKPSDFNSSKKYPVIMSQYSGPGSQEVLDRWTIGAENYFARAGYVVICVDGRGTGGRGRKFMDVVYRNLGYYESIDQVAAARYAASLPFVDPSRIAIYGWSYGGYEAIMAASQSNAPYAAAVAVAPVTDWRYYDTVYAERYMLTPQQNADGYNRSSAMTHIESRRCPLLIMTGTADDNVHMFNSIQYAAEVEDHGMWIDMLLFPNKNHSIYGCNAREVVYAKLLDYLKVNMR